MSGRPSQQRRTQPRNGTKNGVFYGIASFIAGYAMLFVLKGDELLNEFTQGFTSAGPSLGELSQVGGSLPEKWQLTGQFYYVGHNADLSIRAAAAGQEFSQTLAVDFFGGNNTIMWIAPIIALVGGGFLLARRYDFASASDAAKYGARITAGYLPVAVIGIFLFRWETTIDGGIASASMSMQPDLMTSILFVGIVYPVVLGAVGGALSHEL